MIPSLVVPLVEDVILFSYDYCWLLHKKKNQVPIGVWIYVWIFNTISVINVSVFMLMPCRVYYSYVLQLMDGDT